MLGIYSNLMELAKDKSPISLPNCSSLSDQDFDLILENNTLSEHQGLILQNKISKLLRVCACRITTPKVITLSHSILQDNVNTNNPNIITCVIFLESKDTILNFPQINRYEELNLKGKLIIWNNTLKDDPLIIYSVNDCKVVCLKITLLKIE